MHRLTLTLLPLLALSFCDELAAAAEPSATAPTATAPAATSADASLVAAQQATKTAADNLKSAYALALKYDDMTTAGTLAIQLAIHLGPEAGKWLEELAQVHFKTRRFTSCIKIITDLNSQYGGSTKLPLQEMKAMSLEALGRKAEARDAWKIVWDMGGSALHAVRLGGLQFELEDLDAAEASIALGLVASDAKTATLPLPKTREEMQNIPAAAALHNLRALILMKRSPDNKDAARTQLKAALALAPEFELAKRNMAALESSPAPDAKPGDSTAKPKQPLRKPKNG